MYTLRSQSIKEVYTTSLIVVGFVAFLFIYLCYAVIAIKLFADSVLSHNKSVQKSAKITTLAAAIMMLGTVFTINLILAQQYCWYVLHRNILPVDWLRCLLGAGNCFNLTIHPWCLMMLFPDVSWVLSVKSRSFRYGRRCSTSASSVILASAVPSLSQQPNKSSLPCSSQIL